MVAAPLLHQAALALHCSEPTPGTGPPAVRSQKERQEAHPVFPATGGYALLAQHVA